MRILILGHGGREHALCDILSKSKYLTKLFVLNGNPGMAKLATILEGSETHENIVSICLDHHIDLCIPGGESYLSNGIVDDLKKVGVVCFGPSQRAAMIESSKSYAKQIMDKASIPTATYQRFYDVDEALVYIRQSQPPYVIKYDGLALGKGVTVTSRLEEAEKVIKELLSQHIYGNDGIIIEEFLSGKEFSMIAMVHENTVIPLPVARDHKTRFEHNEGPNTGGMGAYSPVDFVSKDIYQESFSILKKCAQTMYEESNPFTGFLYGGFILTKQGPKIIEFNCRLGDPEAEVILPRIQSDFIHLIQSVLSSSPCSIDVDPNYQVGVVMVSDGYPQAYHKGYPIAYDKTIDPMIYHMGTAYKDNELVTSGGRVLCVRGIAHTLDQARHQAYQHIQMITCDHLKYRSDIGACDL